MKYRLILVGFIIFYKTIHCQNNNLYPSLELFMQIINPNNDEITIILESLSPTWDYDKYEGLFFLSTEPYIISSAVSIVGTDTTNNNGWDMVTSKTSGGEVCGIGLYKMKANTGTAFIILDFRECKFALGSQNEIDTWFRYNKPEDKFYWNDKLRINQWNGTTTGNLIRIWDIKQAMTGTSCITDYWQNCLVVIPKKASDGGEAPYLVWGPIPNFQVTGYKIYCSINTQGGPPGNFNLIAQVDANTTEYMHEGLAVGLGWKVYYKVKAFNDSNESGFTNTTEISVSGFYKDNSNNTVDNYNLQPNYPNPFNPTTIIKYHLPEDAHVKLIIYNVLGREVTILVNEFKKVGSYEVEFDARLKDTRSNVRVGRAVGQGSLLPSGIYFYQLKVYPEVVGAGSPKGQVFIQTKKAFLMK